MIKGLILGTKESASTYTTYLEQVRFFSKAETVILSTDNPTIPYINFKNFNAIIFADCPKNIKPIIETAIKHQCNIYLTDQKWLSSNITQQWLSIQREANNLFFCEIPELANPLTEDFLQTYNQTQLIQYEKNIIRRNDIRQTLINALSFICLTNTFRVKKIDINSMDTTLKGKPIYKIRLKMFDHSIAYIILKQTTRKEHHMMFQTQKEKFTFNFSQFYIENPNRVKFTCEPFTYNELITKNIELFALNIIQNKPPAYTLFHYNSVLNIIDKIENILT